MPTRPIPTGPIQTRSTPIRTRAWPSSAGPGCPGRGSGQPGLGPGSGSGSGRGLGPGAAGRIPGPAPGAARPARLADRRPAGRAAQRGPRARPRRAARQGRAAQPQRARGRPGHRDFRRGRAGRRRLGLPGQTGLAGDGPPGRAEGSGRPLSPVPASDGDRAGPARPGRPDAAGPAASRAGEGTGQVASPPVPDRASLRIGILGSFTVNGSSGALLPAQSQLILALALNSPVGLSNAQLGTLLGADPDHPKPSDSLRQLITRTRRQLGRAPGRPGMGGPPGRRPVRPAPGGPVRLVRVLRAGRARPGPAATGPACGTPWRWSAASRSPAATTGGWISPSRKPSVPRSSTSPTCWRPSTWRPATRRPRPARRGPAWPATSPPSSCGGPSCAPSTPPATSPESAKPGLTASTVISDIAPGGEPHPDTAALYRDLLSHPPARSAPLSP